MLSTTTIAPTADLPADLIVSIDWVSGTVALYGELDRDSAHHLLDAILALAATTHPRWLLDASAVTWCDAGGLRALAAAQGLAQESGRTLLLVRPSRCVRRLVTLTGLDLLVAPETAPRTGRDGSGVQHVTGGASRN